MLFKCCSEAFEGDSFTSRVVWFGNVLARQIDEMWLGKSGHLKSEINK